MSRYRNAMIVSLAFGGFVGLSLFFVFIQPKANTDKWKRIQDENWKNVPKGFRESHQPGGMNVWRNPFDKGDKK